MTEQDPVNSADRSVVSPGAPAAPSLDRVASSQRVTEEFSAFYRSNVRQLVGFLAGQGAPLAVAAEIAQEAMMRAFEHWTGLVTPRPWVYKVASRLLVRKIASVEEPVEQVPEPTSLVARPDAIGDWESQYDLRPALQKLPPRQRQVMAWTLVGFTPGDIAEHLSLPSEQVRANLAKARRALVANLTRREDL